MNGEFVNSQCVRCLFADIREPCLNVFKCPVIILFSYTLSCFLCNFRVYSIGQDGESGLCSKAAGLPEGEEAFHPAVAFLSLGAVAAFSPLHAEAQGAFRRLLVGSTSASSRKSQWVSIPRLLRTDPSLNLFQEFPRVDRLLRIVVHARFPAKLHISFDRMGG